MSGFKISQDKDDQTIDTNLELLKSLLGVNQKSVHEAISEDFTMAKLSDKDKKGTIEMTTNAFFCKKMIGDIAKKTEATKKWKWIEIEGEQGQWIPVYLTKEQKERIAEIATETFNGIMTRVQVNAIMNRNLKGNWLVGLLGKEEKDKTNEEEEEKPQKDWLGREKKAKKEEED